MLATARPFLFVNVNVCIGRVIVLSLLFLFPVKTVSLVQAYFELLFVTKNVEFATFTQTVMITTVLLNTGSSLNIE